MEKKILEYLNTLPEQERRSRLISYVSTYVPEDQRRSCQIRSVLALHGYALLWEVHHYFRSMLRWRALCMDCLPLGKVVMM